MALAQMQRQLQSLYDVSLEHSVEDYLVTDRAFLDAVSRRNSRRDRFDASSNTWMPSGAEYTI